VFVVGYLGDWRAAAAVLFERHSLSGDSAPSREKRKEVAACISAGIAISDYEVAGTLDKGIPGRGIGHNGNYDSQVVSVGGLCARTGLSNSAQDAQQGYLLPIALQDVTSREKAQNGKGWNDDGSAYTVDTHATQGVAQPIAFSGQMSEPQTNVDMTQTLQAKNPMAVAVGTDLYNGAITGEVAVPMTNRSDGTGTGPTVMQPICLMDQGGSVMNIEHDMSGTLRRETHGHEPIVMQSVAFEPGKMKRLGYGNAELGLSPTLRASAGDNQVAASVGMAVRRLTPVECERLQGFPDNYTDIQPKGKATPDGPRYKALGNSMAVPVMAWIGKRIQEVEKMQCKPNK